jgi:GntR family transcriptional regulator
MARVNRTSKLPLYQQLYDILRADLQRGEWQPGSLLPSEADLTARYAVSRITVRQVLGMLTKEGLIYRQRGRGTFAAHPTVEQGAGRIVSFTEDMRRRGFEPASRVLSSGLLPAPSDIAAKLQIPAGEELACIERLRLADDEPMSLERSFLVHRLFPGILQRRDYSRDSLRQVLEERYRVHIGRAAQVIRAVPATRSLARLLSVPARSPLLFVERTSYSADDTPVEYLRIHFRADRYALHGELHD